MKSWILKRFFASKFEQVLAGKEHYDTVISNVTFSGQTEKEDGKLSREI
jgi:hypothetical protein